MKKICLAAALLIYLSPAAHAGEQYALLSRGAQGENVARLQNQLSALGYLDDYTAGVYDESTREAVLYLQFDMGLCPTGTASSALQNQIYAGEVSSRSDYVLLKRSMYGLRVRDLQERLYQLRYTKNTPTGYYDGETARAVSRFQMQNGYKAQGDAINKKQQAALFKKSAAPCQIYFTLAQKDSGPMVKALNQRLKKLGFLSGSPTNAYNKKTVKAVKAFQKSLTLTQTGVCDPLTQRLLFSDEPVPPQITPTPAPTPAPVPETPAAPAQPGKQAVENSVIKTMRTWMNKNLDSTLDKEGAVALFQTRLFELGYLEEEAITGIYDQTTLKAAKVFQKDAGLKATGNPSKTMLKKMFPAE